MVDEIESTRWWERQIFLLAWLQTYSKVYLKGRTKAQLQIVQHVLVISFSEHLMMMMMINCSMERTGKSFIPAVSISVHESWSNSWSNLNLFFLWEKVTEFKSECLENHCENIAQGWNHVWSLCIRCMMFILQYIAIFHVFFYFIFCIHQSISLSFLLSSNRNNQNWYFNVDGYYLLCCSHG